jgi:serine/threonine-protein phosphatase 6 regulatory ankyrin repeat subunit A/serine/threonine-protein phosphatase 6 regulatory ankyrin repeat subunit B
MKFVLFITLTTKNKKMEIFNFIQNNSINQIEQFIHNCADVNAKDKYGYTPLMAALWSKNNKNIIKLLLNNGADVNANDKDGNTPLIFALHYKNNKYIIQLLLDNGALVNAKDEIGDTPLIVALKSKYDKNIIKLFLDNGANDDLETLKEKIKESDYKTEMLLFIHEY